MRGSATPAANARWAAAELSIRQSVSLLMLNQMKALTLLRARAAKNCEIHCALSPPTSVLAVSPMTTGRLEICRRVARLEPKTPSKGCHVPQLVLLPQL